MTKIVKKITQTYSVYVYNSSGSQGGNRYSSFSDLMTAVQKQEGVKYIQAEQDETIPAGAWNFDYCEFWGNGQAYDSGGYTWTFPTGVTISSWSGRKVVNFGLYFKSTSNAAIYTTSTSGTLVAQNVAAIGSTTAEFVSTSAAQFVISATGSGRLLNAGYELVNGTGTAFAQQLIIAIGDGAAIGTNLLRSTNSQIDVQVLQTIVLDASAFPKTQANMAASSVHVSLNFLYAANITYNVRTSTTGTITCSKAYSHERANAAGGNVTYTLRSAVGGGDRVSFKKVDSSGNSMIINRAGSDTIDGATSLTTTTQYAGWILQDVASGVWDIISVIP